MKLKSTEPDSWQEAWKYALRLLNARDYTSQRLLGKLTDKGYDPAAAEQAIARLQQEGWLNDSRFALRFAEAAVAAGRYFGARLRLEMKRRGFPPDIIATTLEQVTEQHAAMDEIRSLLERRYGRFSYHSAADREKRRVLGYLQRKGFALSDILTCLKQDTP